MKKLLLILGCAAIVLAQNTTQTATNSPNTASSPNTFRVTVFEESAGLIASFNTNIEPGHKDDVIVINPLLLASGINTNTYGNKLLIIRARSVIYGPFPTIQINVIKIK